MMESLLASRPCLRPLPPSSSCGIFLGGKRIRRFNFVVRGSHEWSLCRLSRDPNSRFSVSESVVATEETSPSGLECNSKEEGNSTSLNGDQVPRFLSKNALLSIPILELSTLFPDSFNFSVSEILNDIVLGSITVIGAVVWVKFFDELSKRDVFSQKLSRKIVHITTGLIFMLFWPLFSGSYFARFFAVAAPLSNIFRLVALGTGVVTDEAAVKSISREGNPKELLRGPLFYTIVFAIVTIGFWRNSPVAPISLGLMCAGDGIADIVGRKYGAVKLPWNSHKSFAGSISMFLFGTLASLAFTYYFFSFGFFHSLDWSSTIAKTLLVTSISTLVESLPLPIDDNLSVPGTAILSTALLFSVLPLQ